VDTDKTVYESKTITPFSKQVVSQLAISTLELDGNLLLTYRFSEALQFSCSWTEFSIIQPKIAGRITASTYDAVDKKLDALPQPKGWISKKDHLKIAVKLWWHLGVQLQKRRSL